ncbi:MAG: endo-1,4-beta-xylanase [Sedimentisphaerales bacterium]|jgi:endo-1,4-beta-xylanase
MSNVLELINSAGKGFVEFAWPMLWQSGMLVVILLAADYILRKKVGAVFRYGLWMLVIVKLVLPTSLSSPVSIGQFMIVPAGLVKMASHAKPQAGNISGTRFSSDATTESQLNTLSAEQLALLRRPVSPLIQLNESSGMLTWQGGVLLLWVIVACAMLLLLMQRVMFVLGLVRQSKEAGDEMRDTLEDCRKTMNISGYVGLKESPNAVSPAVCGLFRPVILLPGWLNANLDAGQFKIVLMHELAHIRRRDLWVNLVQTLLQIVYFYNPFIWLANWMIRRVREQAVDEAVQVALGEKSPQYPEALLNIARFAFGRPVFSMRSIGVVESRSALAERIKKMLNGPAPKNAKLNLPGALIVILIGLLTLPMTRSTAEEPARNTVTCKAKSKSTYLIADSNQYSLKDVFKNDFSVGTALSCHQLSDKEVNDISIVPSQFNSITPEHFLKWSYVHPEPDKYNFEAADRYVAFGETNKMFIVGHVLIAPDLIPDWVFQDDNGKTVSREVLLNRMREHILTVVGRYKGRINGWDVVNEAIGNDGQILETKWCKIIGRDYIQKAFEYAHEADPNAELYYNDYNVWSKKDIDSIVRLVGTLKAKGLRIDGIGMQAHWGLYSPSPDAIENSIVALSQSGVKVMISEIDISVLPCYDSNKDGDIKNDPALQKKFNPYPDTLPAEVQEKLAERYGELFAVFHKHADKISRVTLWGVQDGQSWLNRWPVEGRADYPLLFDRNLKSKPAYYAVIKTAQNNQ